LFPFFIFRYFIDTKEILLNDLLNVFRREEDNIVKNFKAMQTGQMAIPASNLVGPQQQNSLMSILSNFGMSTNPPAPNLGKHHFSFFINFSANIMGNFNPIIPQQQQQTSLQSQLGTYFFPPKTTDQN
jgi:hypothetical protein